MRTTVKLDDDVVRIVRRTMREEAKSFSEALNDCVRRAAVEPGRVAARRRRFRVRPHSSPFVGTVDAEKLNQLADQLEVEAAAARILPRRRG